jgi:hypothetical protein
MDAREAMRAVEVAEAVYMRELFERHDEESRAAPSTATRWWPRRRWSSRA